jgi:hypothetical protein
MDNPGFNSCRDRRVLPSSNHHTSFVADPVLFRRYWGSFLRGKQQGHAVNHLHLVVLRLCVELCFHFPHMSSWHGWDYFVFDLHCGIAAWKKGSSSKMYIFLIIVCTFDWANLKALHVPSVFTPEFRCFSAYNFISVHKLVQYFFLVLIILAFVKCLELMMLHFHR